MRVVYVVEPGSRIRARKGGVYVEPRNGKRIAVTPDVEQVVVASSRVSLSSKALRILAREGVDVVILDARGYPIARLYPPFVNKTVASRIAQYQYILSGKGLRVAVEIAYCKILNQARLLQRWLAIALWYAAAAVHTISRYEGVVAEGYVLILEEDEASAVPEAYPTLEERIMRIPILARLAVISEEEVKILRAVEAGYRRAKQLQRALGVPLSTMQERLSSLVRKKLLHSEKRGKSYLYTLTPLAVMLVAEQPLESSRSTER